MNLTSTFGTEPSFGELLAAALANGSLLDHAGTTRDMVALLARFRVVDAEAADKAVAGARQALADNNPALQLLETVDQNSRTDNPDLLPFGPVRHVDLGAVERLAMLTQVGFLSDSFLSLFSQGAADFVLSSGGGMPPVIHVASLVQDRLGRSTLNALRWRDEVIPSLLQVSFELTDLVVAGAGGDALPGEWAETERFLTPWVKSRSTLKPDSDGGGSDDGFLRGNRPGAIHPLVLRILRPKVQTMLVSNDPAVVEEATAFNAFLADAAVATDAAVAASPDLFPPAGTPGCASVAGAFILASARTRGTTIDKDGTIQAPAGAEPFGALADRVLKALIFGGESGLQPLPPAWVDKAHLKDLLQACPDWGAASFGTPLRGRAQVRLGATLSDLSVVLTAQAANVPSDQLLPKAELLAALFAARPVTARGAVIEAVDQAVSALKTVKAISDEAANVRRVFEAQFASPIAEPTLVNLLPARAGSDSLVDVTDGAIATYLVSKIGLLAPESLAKALDSAGTWATAVNQVGSSVVDLLQSSMPLELWDGLRGRLMRPADQDEAKLVDDLGQRLPDWLRGPLDPPPPATIDLNLNQLRPALAAVSLVGLPLVPRPNSSHQIAFKPLLARLETLLDPNSGLSTGARALLAAAHVELTLSFVSASSNDLILDQVFGGLDDLKQFANRSVTALQSKVAWEARAGLNALILLARLVDVTGDPLTAQVLDQSLTTDVQELVASSVVRLLSTATMGPAVSALPLALVGSDLSRFARESTQALDRSPTKPPSWLTSPQLTPDLNNRATLLIKRLAARFSDRAANPLRAFTWQGGRAGRSLLLSVFQIELNELARTRRFTVNPLVTDDAALQALQQLERAVRGVFCTERVPAGRSTADPRHRAGALVEHRLLVRADTRFGPGASPGHDRRQDISPDELGSGLPGRCGR